MPCHKGIILVLGNWLEGDILWILNDKISLCKWLLSVLIKCGGDICLSLLYSPISNPQAPAFQRTILPSHMVSTEAAILYKRTLSL